MKDRQGLEHSELIDETCSLLNSDRRVRVSGEHPTLHRIATKIVKNILAIQKRS